MAGVARPAGAEFAQVNGLDRAGTGTEPPFVMRYAVAGFDTAEGARPVIGILISEGRVGTACSVYLEKTVTVHTAHAGNGQGPGPME